MANLQSVARELNIWSDSIEVEHFFFIYLQQLFKQGYLQKKDHSGYHEAHTVAHILWLQSRLRHLQHQFTLQETGADSWRTYGGTAAVSTTAITAAIAIYRVSKPVGIA
jgi:hypothetical protein